MPFSGVSFAESRGEGRGVVLVFVNVLERNLLNVLRKQLRGEDSKEKDSRIRMRGGPTVRSSVPSFRYVKFFPSFQEGLRYAEDALMLEHDLRSHTGRTSRTSHYSISVSPV